MHHFLLVLQETNDFAITWESIEIFLYIATVIAAAIIAVVKFFIINPKNQEIQRLQKEFETRLQYPSYISETVNLTELAADKKITEIQKEYEEAVEKKDKKSAKKISKHLKEINDLKNDLDKVASEYSSLQKELQGSLINREYVHSGRAIRLPTGFILLIKCNGKFGALKAIDQSFKQRRGAFIKYYWWYQPKNSGIFTTPEVQSGFGEADESGKGSSLMKIGPITLPWSAAGEGMGWVYFENHHDPETIMELVVSDEIDITKINSANYEFLKPHDGKAKKVKLRKK